MDILNPRPALAMPQTMWLCYSAVANNNGISEDQLFRLVVPEELLDKVPQGGAHVRRAVGDLVELGLIEIDSEGLLSAESNDATGFLRKLRRLVVVPPVDISKSFEGAPDLRSGLIWLMRQSPFVPLHWNDSDQGRIPFLNDTRWNAFTHWSVVLGFARPALKVFSPGVQGSITVDPTDAVIDVLTNPWIESHFPEGERIPVVAFMNSLRSELPIVPGHPSAVYDGMDVHASNEWAAVGLALSCAETRGVLRMGYQSDPSGVVALPGNEGSGRARYVSWIEVMK
ncbi:hypothetical protein [Nocardia farcinica]|uniref:hypothetical protein n=1 Tax=Nocardia farcinica TaxID=37329 RepID=UPI0024575C36|nr:hypothetical protein [Nocardia farcinica]